MINFNQLSVSFLPFTIKVKASMRNVCLFFVCSLFVLVIVPTTASAQVDTFEFETDEQLQRFRTLSNELRCPMCQNTNLSGSTGGVAEDLRREVHRMIVEGMSDSEIEQFMFERYGDFIFYRPRLRAETVLLWFGPIIFLGIGGFIAFGIVRNARRKTEGEAGNGIPNSNGGSEGSSENSEHSPKSELAEVDKARLARLLQD